MLRSVVALISYLFILVVCCNYCVCTYTTFNDLVTYKESESLNFTIEPSVSVGSVVQFWTNTGLRYVIQFN